MPANRLRELRDATEPRPTQKQLAALVGRDSSTYHRYEVGEVPLTSNEDGMKALAKFYGVTVEHLLGWDREEAAA